jgi:hypothetical protein
MHHPHRSRIGVAYSGLLLTLIACGSKAAFSPPPINLSVSVNNTTIVVPPNGTPVNVPVTIVAPTETATFTISGLPAGVTESYKESESNPSGLLTLVANATTVPGTYMPKITVGTLGQTASVVFTLVISTLSKPVNAKTVTAGRTNQSRTASLACPGVPWELVEGAG